MSDTVQYDDALGLALNADLERLLALAPSELLRCRADILAATPFSPFIPSPKQSSCLWCGRASSPTPNPNWHDPILPAGPPPPRWIHHSCWHRRQRALHLPHQPQPEIIPEA